MNSSEEKDIFEIFRSLEKLMEQAIHKEKYDIYQNADRSGYIIALHNEFPRLRDEIISLKSELIDINVELLEAKSKCIFYERSRRAVISAYLSAIEKKTV